ncbi:MAG TPA: AmmeMemoRadiSam system protein B [Chloroflexota bacterium]
MQPTPGNPASPADPETPPGPSAPPGSTLDGTFAVAIDGVVAVPERPRLRALDAFPATIEGQNLICLRDPSGFSDDVIGLPRDLIPLLEAMDGTHTLLDLQVAETQRQGRIVLQSELEDLVSALDSHLFLASAHFEATINKTADDFRQAPVRAAFHAGRAYPTDPEALHAFLDGFFADRLGPGPIAEPQVRGTVAGVLAPHIDFTRGGPVYAWAYRALAEAEPADLYVVLGVPHQGLNGPAAATLKSYDTPFGPLAVDGDFVEGLQRRSGLDLLQEEMSHRVEHSVEFEAVFLQHLFAGRRDIRFVPILVDFVHRAMVHGQNPRDENDGGKFVDALAETISAYPGRVCVIGGVDLAHVGPQFGDPLPITSERLTWLEAEDREMLAAVGTGDPQAFYESVAKDGDRRRICGLSPIYTLLSVLGQPGRLLKYGQAPDPNGTVTFTSFVFEN